jgi:hypothetical protein
MNLLYNYNNTRRYNMKWDLTQIFKTESDYEKAFETIKKLSEDLYKYENKLNTLENIDNMYKLNDEIDLIIGKCYSYVSLHANLNLKDAKLNAKLEELSLFLVEELLVSNKEKLFERYKISSDFEYEMPLDVLEEIGRKRGCLVRGGEIDYTKVANIVIDEFRTGKIGNISLEIAP